MLTEKEKVNVMADLKEKFNYTTDTVKIFMIILGYAFGICMSIMVWIVFDDPSNCSDKAIISLQHWLLGFAVASAICSVYVATCLILTKCLKINLGIFFNTISPNVFFCFFFIYHWFVYDALFSKNVDITCLTDEFFLWATTFTIVIIQLTCIIFYITSVLILNALDRFYKSLPDNIVAINEAGQQVTENTYNNDGDLIIDL